MASKNHAIFLIATSKDVKLVVDNPGYSPECGIGHIPLSGPHIGTRIVDVQGRGESARRVSPPGNVDFAADNRGSVGPVQRYRQGSLPGPGVGRGIVRLNPTEAPPVRVLPPIAYR